MRVAHARGVIETPGCLVMGIVNRTPDSFYDGGRMGLDESLAFSERLVIEGADILDVGAVKAGPGQEVSEQDERQRLLPLIEALSDRQPVPISVETSRPSVARDAIAAGAAIVNDVSSVADPELLDVCAQTGAAIVLMHNGGQIRGRPRHPRYGDVVAEVRGALTGLAERALERGIDREAVVIDPGLDFGKNTFQSLELMKRVEDLVSTGFHVAIAASRKDVVGETLGLPPSDRLEGSLALAVLAAVKGARVVRVHDVEATVRCLRMVAAVEGIVSPIAPVRGLWD